MGKKKTATGLGSSIIKDRFKGRSRPNNDSFLHTTDMEDGYDWGRLNLQSVTEQSNLEDFLATAELAGTEFTAEKMNVAFVNTETSSGLLTDEQKRAVHHAQNKHRKLLKIPRRPAWDENTTPDELDANERRSFLEWRRSLAELQEVEHLILTPFEKNLEFWRQLWRVIERSDIIVQIVDGRNPLLFRCEDLETYVKEKSSDKVNVLLINKADFLTHKQRCMWAEYFDRVAVRVIFWSAMAETERIKALAEEAAVAEEANTIEGATIYSSDDEYTDDDDEEEVTDMCPEGGSTSPAHKMTDAEDLTNDSEKNASANVTESVENMNLEGQSGTEEHADPSSSKNNPKLVTGEELLAALSDLHTATKVTEGVTTVGLVGYPNVGKSSTINAILQTKKVPVSATPGRTKHFQTLYVDPTLLLCDCPGLVMPTFVSTKAEMVVSGILPVDQMRDHVPPVSLVCDHIPRSVLEATYGIMLPRPQEGEDPNRPPTSAEFLSAYAYMRGFMTHKGIPDQPRSARLVLKDYLNGKLLYSHPPPGCDVTVFKPWAEASKIHKPTLPQGHKSYTAAWQSGPSKSQAVDRQFFSKSNSHVGEKGTKKVSTSYQSLTGSASHAHIAGGNAEKPWRKHNNKRKKEKLRRLHSDLDVHM